jgi:hypothetical protein
LRAPAPDTAAIELPDWLPAPVRDHAHQVAEYIDCLPDHLDILHRLAIDSRMKYAWKELRRRQYAALGKEYRIREVVGDAYAAQWVAGTWRETGIDYRKSPLPKSAIYLECIPLFARGLVRLPDHAKLLRELRLLERQTHRGGKDSVDSPKNAHDDFANAVCGALQLVGRIVANPDPPIVMPYIHSVPRRFPGSPAYDDAPVAADSPHRPSREAPWYPYVRGW